MTDSLYHRTKDQIRRFIPRLAKRWISSLLINRYIGTVAGIVLQDRIPFRGTLINTAHNRIAATAKAALFWGFYERPEIDQINRFLPCGYDVVELGASIGVASTQIAKRLEAANQLISIEADPEIFQVLQQNLQTNACGKRFRTLNKALWYDGATTIPFRSAASTLSGRVLSEGTCIKAHDDDEVAVCRLSELLAQFGIGDYVLVADIEGAEVQLFQHESTALNGCFRVIIELHDTELAGNSYDVEDARKLIQSKGFKLLHRHGQCCVFERAA